MAYRVRERIIFELGPHHTLPGTWYIKLSDKQFVIITPWILLGFYDEAMDFYRIATKCGWEIAWKRAPLGDERLFLRDRKQIEYHYIN